MVKITLFLVLLSGLVASVLGFPACSSGYSGPVELAVIGTMANAGDALIFIAEEQNYFVNNGLDITLKTFDSGLAATNAMIDGEADLAYATEFVVVGKILQNQEIKIIVTYSKNETVSLVGRKDEGIEVVSDLKGKKIGLSRGTINEFYLGRMLNLNGMSIDDVTLVNIKLTELESALSSGDVDAIVAGSRNLYPIIQQYGSNVFVWPAHSGQPASGTLVVKSDWASQHPELVRRLLKSLSEAEQYIFRNPDKARAAVQKRLNYDDEYMATVWSEYQFSLSLDQSLITAMEDEARWMMSNNLTAEKQVPNFNDYIYEDALKEVKPEAVNIIK